MSIIDQILNYILVIRPVNPLWSEHRIRDENLSSVIDIIYFRVQDAHGHYFIPTSTHHTGTWQRVFFDLR